MYIFERTTQPFSDDQQKIWEHITVLFPKGIPEKLEDPQYDFHIVALQGKTKKSYSTLFSSLLKMSKNVDLQEGQKAFLNDLKRAAYRRYNLEKPTQPLSNDQQKIWEHITSLFPEGIPETLDDTQYDFHIVALQGKTKKKYAALHLALFKMRKNVYLQEPQKDILNGLGRAANRRYLFEKTTQPFSEDQKVVWEHITSLFPEGIPETLDDTQYDSHVRAWPTVYVGPVLGQY